VFSPLRLWFFPLLPESYSIFAHLRGNLNDLVSGFKTKWQQLREDSRPPEVDVSKALKEVSLMPAFSVLPLPSHIDLCQVMF
jgi:hypothetical protein